MPYEMIWEDRGLYRRFYGHVSDQEINRAVDFVESSSHFDGLRYVINDFLDVAGFEMISPSFIEERAAIDSGAAMSNPDVKVAIVSTLPHITNLATEYAAHPLTPFPTQIFSSVADARIWVSANTPVYGRSRKGG